MKVSETALPGVLVIEPRLFTDGRVPPPYPLHKFLGQSWTRNLCRDADFGVLGRFALADGWSLRAGLFRHPRRTPGLPHRGRYASGRSGSSQSGLRPASLDRGPCWR